MCFHEGKKRSTRSKKNRRKVFNEFAILYWVNSVSLLFLWLFTRERIVQIVKNYIQILIQKIALFHIDFQFEWIFDCNGVCQRRRLRKAYEHDAFRALAIIPLDDRIWWTSDIWLKPQLKLETLITYSDLILITLDFIPVIFIQLQKF